MYITYIYMYHVYLTKMDTCNVWSDIIGRPNSSLIRQKHEMIRKCLMSDCYFPLCTQTHTQHVYMQACLLITTRPSVTSQSPVAVSVYIYIHTHSQSVDRRDVNLIIWTQRTNNSVRFLQWIKQSSAS